MSVRRDIDAELRFHFEARIEELVAQGLSSDAARTQAAAEFGDVERTRAQLHEIGSRVARRRSRAEVIDAIVKDVAYSLRSLRRSTAISVTIIITLGLGLGANAAMFSMLETIYLRPPTGVTAPSQLKRVWAQYRFRDGIKFWPGFDYAAYAATARALDGKAAVVLYREDQRRLGRGEAASMVHIVGATANYFLILGIRPALGRFYTAPEDALNGSAQVAVISDALWTSRFSRDPNVLGTELAFGDTKLVIIGVAPPGFRGVDLGVTDVWMPIEASLGGRYGSDQPWWQNPNINNFQMVLRPARDLGDNELAQRVTQALRGPITGGGRLDSLTVAEVGSINRARGPGKVSGEMQVAIRLAGVAVIVLLIACANVINLLLLRALNRRREIAVRLALGISRSRLIRLIVTESVLLSLAAAPAAIAIAHWGGGLLRALLMPGIEWAESPVDWRVFMFALTAAIVAGMVAGLVPAVRSASADLTDALKTGSRDGAPARSRLRTVLVAAQAALSVVLLVGAVLFVRSLQNVKAHDLGYVVPQLAFATIEYDSRDSARDAMVAQRMSALEPRVAAISGVQRVAFTERRPKRGFRMTSYFPDADTTIRHKPFGFISPVTPSFFEAAGTKLLRGQVFGSGARGTLATVVNQAMADALWPNQNPIGRCVRFGTPNAPCATIVGVVQTAMMLSFDESPTPRFYVSIDYPPVNVYPGRDLVIRADAHSLPSAMSAVRDLLRAEFPGASLDITTMSQAMEPDYRSWDLGATLFTLFGLLALLVASIGIYSTVSYSVSRRTHEFGVRIALGARAKDIVRHVLGEGLRTVVGGLVVGIALALAAGRLVATLLYGITPRDPVAMGIVVMILVTVALIAGIVPAWRAARADPVSAMRAE